MKKINGYKCYTVQEVAEILDISEITVKKYLRNGKIVGQKIGQRWWVTAENLDKFVRGVKQDQ